MVLRYLFVDMNSYFASVEQQENPALRGRPVGVIPSLVETTCCIAASYEAKAKGVKTGTSVRDARKLCPTITLVASRPRIYVQYHHRIVEAVESCLHVEQVCSIDEMYGRLYDNEQSPEIAAGIAHAVKDAIAKQVGQWVRCSVGLGPNIWLAKMGTELQKPDGLVMILPEQLPEQIAHLTLTDLPGIARGMQRRLNKYGVKTIVQFYAQSEARLRTISGSRVWASLWYNQLRGYDLPPLKTHRRMVGHSHVLPPSLRTNDHARAVCVRLIHKAAARMRRLGYWTGKLSVRVKHIEGTKWKQSIDLGLVRDTLSIVQAFAVLWSGKPVGRPLQVGVVLSHLVAESSVSLPLFTDQVRRDALADAMDAIDHSYGIHTIYTGSMLGYTQAAPTRISFTQIPKMNEF